MTAVLGEETTYTPDQVRDAAYRWHAAGFTVLPVTADGQKRPDGGWKQYQHEQPTAQQLSRWFDGTGRTGLGALMGAISGNVEMLELEGRAVDEGARDKIVPALKAAGVFNVWQRLVRGYVDISPSGGPHFIYRITDHEVPGNTKVAQRPSTPEELAANPSKKVQALAETRGEGGFTVLAPSHGTTHPSGNPWELGQHSTPGVVAEITWAERTALFAAIRAVLDEMPEVEPPAPRAPVQPTTDGSERPGEAFARQTSWAQILEPHGWRHVYRRGDMDYWRRPGDDKRIGWSARTGGRFDGLWVWSTSTEFPTEVSITKFRAYAILEHGGNDRTAAAQLRREGFGGAPLYLTDSLAATASAVVAPGPAQPPDGDPYEEFWERRPRHALVRQVARERRVSPWSVMGGVLAVVCAKVGPHVQLPPIVGSYASLNTFWAHVGASGGGKDSGTDVALDLIECDDVPVHEIGTGQGIDASYTTTITKVGPVQFCDTALFRVSEVDTIGAHAKATGATVLPTLRKAYSGQRLGAQYADPTKRRPVKAHYYRLALAVGVQPLKSGTLLDDADGGTPQRFVWLPTNDPHRPVTARNAPVTQVPAGGIWECPPRLRAQGEMNVNSEGDQEMLKRGQGVAHLARIVIEVCETARNAILDAREERLDQDLMGDETGLNGHALLTRLKVAALLALYDDGRTSVTDEDWWLADFVMKVSDETRAVCLAALAVAKTRDNRAAGRADAEREEARGGQDIARAARLVVACLNRHAGNADGGWVTSGKLRANALESRDRDLFEMAVKRAEQAGQIERAESKRGHKFRWIGG